MRPYYLVGFIVKPVPDIILLLVEHVMESNSTYEKVGERCKRIGKLFSA